jgi:HSP20 family protein
MANIIRRPEPGITTGRHPGSDTWRMLQDLLHWDPFREMSQISGEERPLAFVPQFEVKETPESFVFKADIPGVKDQDLDISLTGNRLTISGKRDAEEVRDDERFFAYERVFGSFSRSFTLPAGTDPDAVQANLEHGVLTLFLPKKPEHQPRKISLVDKLKKAVTAPDKGAKA